MLKMTGVELELLTEINLHLFVESGVRGGCAMISNRHAVANNPLIPDPVSYTHLDVYKRQPQDLSTNNKIGFTPLSLRVCCQSQNVR